MMDLLNQMADDEAKSVNEGVKNIEEDDGGIPLPDIVLNHSDESENDGDSENEEGKKKGKKEKKNKKDSAQNDSDASGEDTSKEPGKINKFFNMLTEDLVPEPTEEELAAEKAAKEAKKQENLTKKQEEKQAKEEEKKAKAEEKAAEKKAKADEAAKKKKEKDDIKKAKAEEKKAKKAAAEAQRHGKKIPKKNIIAATLFGATVGGAVIISTNVLSKQGYLQTARNAYYEQDYKTVYLSTYGMTLDSSESDGLIQARSEVILKMQRRYDSYQTNVKMGREVEALDALLQGLATYDYINAEAEQYGVMTEVDEIKSNILDILQTKYGLDEEAARSLMNEEDSVSYTLALDNIVNGN
jgi:DNA mismatch repair ATPase MutL